jgi:hypothetical protein
MRVVTVGVRDWEESAAAERAINVVSTASVVRRKLVD